MQYWHLSSSDVTAKMKDLSSFFNFRSFPVALEWLKMSVFFIIYLLIS